MELKSFNIVTLYYTCVKFVKGNLPENCETKEIQTSLARRRINFLSNSLLQSATASSDAAGNYAMGAVALITTKLESLQLFSVELAQSGIHALSFRSDMRSLCTIASSSAEVLPLQL